MCHFFGFFDLGANAGLDAVDSACLARRETPTRADPSNRYNPITVTLIHHRHPRLESYRGYRGYGGVRERSNIDLCRRDEARPLWPS
jgi:hypothetical protein